MSLAAKAIPRQIRVLVLGEHAMMRAGVRLLIEKRPGLVVVGDARTYSDAVAHGIKRTDVVVLDHDFEKRQLELISELAAVAKPARLVVLTANTEADLHSRVVRHGVMGLVLKHLPGDVLPKAIEKVHDGEVWLDRSLIARVLAAAHRSESITDPDANRIAALTQREGEVIAGVAEGLKNRQIGERLFISETTVHHHLTSIFSKLAVSDRFELLIYAYKHGLARPPL